MAANPRLWLVLLVAGASVLAVQAGKPKYTPLCPMSGSAPNQRSCCVLCNRTRVCVDFESDPRNCGSCFTRCGASQTCQAGVCVTPPAQPSPSPSPSPAATPSIECQSRSNNCSAKSDCCPGRCCLNGVCVSNVTTAACGVNCFVCNAAQTCTSQGACALKQSTISTNTDIFGVSTCIPSGDPTQPPSPVNVVPACATNTSTSAQAYSLNITRNNFAGLGIQLNGCMTVSLCDMNSDASVGGVSSGNNVDLSWTPPLSLNSTLPTCAAANCDPAFSPASTLLSRINVLNSGQDEVVNIISRNNICLQKLGVRLTAAPNCTTYNIP